MEFVRKIKVLDKRLFFIAHRLFFNIQRLFFITQTLFFITQILFFITLISQSRLFFNALRDCFLIHVKIKKRGAPSLSGSDWLTFLELFRTLRGIIDSWRVGGPADAFTVTPVASPPGAIRFSPRQSL